MKKKNCYNAAIWQPPGRGGLNLANLVKKPCSFFGVIFLKKNPKKEFVGLTAPKQKKIRILEKKIAPKKKMLMSRCK